MPKAAKAVDFKKVRRVDLELIRRGEFMGLFTNKGKGVHE